MIKQRKVGELKHEVSKDTVAILVDGQNVDACKYSRDILNLAMGLGELSFSWFYHHWDRMKLYEMKRMKDDGWETINVLEAGKNALDYQAMNEIKQRCNIQGMPDILILVTCDKDFLPLVKDFLRAKRRVIIVGRRNAISHRLLSWVHHDFYWVEELSRCPLSFEAF
ncbi:MAG: hypothetical protein DCF21_12400 [Leptolyngbya sp.]|nr:MAG: hypothetical protein DCF21_12400 [Leptolyngbya sp.]